MCALLTASSPTMSPKLPVAALLLLLLLPLASEGQRQILGDITEQRISQVYDEDVRDDTLYRRPPIYLIIASKIVRPSTVYQVRCVKPGWRSGGGRGSSTAAVYFRFGCRC